MTSADGWTDGWKHLFTGPAPLIDTGTGTGSGAVADADSVAVIDPATDAGGG